ncbi:MAG: PAS domain S-box protein [Candidatus Desulfaltia sp.]|nr:PAS domain S-box protein [Candidatus Desulfaltia sp.]
MQFEPQKRAHSPLLVGAKRRSRPIGAAESFNSPEKRHLIDHQNQSLKLSILGKIYTMKKFLLLCFSFIVALNAPLLHAAEMVKPSGRVAILQEVLILNSYHPGYAWSDDEQAGIIDTLRTKNKNWVPVIEYLYLKRLPEGRHLAELKQLFSFKYQNKKFSAVIAIDDPALEFAIDNQEKLFGNAPIVFCGINNYTSSLLKGHSEVTGVVEAIDIAGTIESMLRLHPATQEIFNPNDYTVSGLAMRKKLEAMVPRFGAKVRFRFNDPLTMEELLEEMKRLPKNSLVLETAFITDKSGRTFDTAETTKLFYEHSPVPIYSTYEQRLGFGIVGGKLLSARIHGASAGRIALRVLAGEKASAIPVASESDSQFMFDYKVMNRFGIPLSALPEHSTVINQPVSFYATHRMVIQTASGIIVVMTIMISMLIVIIAQRRRSTILLLASEERHRDILQKAMDGILMMDMQGRLLEVNEAYCRMSGYSRQELLSTRISDLEVVETEDNTADHIQKIVAQGRDSFSTRHRRKDGSIFDIEVSTQYRPENGGQIVVFLHNITNRKIAEKNLQKSLLSAVRAIASIVELKDPYTAGHQRRVSALSLAP